MTLQVGDREILAPFRAVACLAAVLDLAYFVRPAWQALSSVEGGDTVCNGLISDC